MPIARTPSITTRRINLVSIVQKEGHYVKECKYKINVDKKVGTSNTENHKDNVVETENKDFVAMIAGLHMASIVVSKV